MVEQMSDAGVPIMDPKKLDAKDLIDRLTKANTEMVEMRRNTDRKLAETAEKHRVELDRLRGTTANHIRDVEAENKALLRSLSRLQIESDGLRNENIILKSRIESKADTNGVAAPSVPVSPLSPFVGQAQ